MKIAVTGEIGSGKSVFMELAEAYPAFACFSADAINAGLLSDSAYLGRLRVAFPEAFSDGVFSKATLSDMIFKDAVKRKKLNSIAHPEIAALTLRLTAEAEARGKIVLMEVPLLLESGIEEIFDKIVLIKAPAESRAERITKRRGVTPVQALARIRSQNQDTVVESFADIVIENYGSLDQFRLKALAVLDALSRGA
ncbi:MAG: dephospho-CoA kinase [Clostridiaceae bacterium]|jgi:dephospho-CoA kinase|nr:dephospho-CoA kinase [Clostridiaceae bacterium]